MTFREGETYEAIVLWRRKRRNYSIYTFLTAKLGTIACSVPHSRLKNLKNSGYLQPFSDVFITVAADGEYYHLEQVDGRFLVRAVDQDLKAICYTAFAGELLSRLFRRGTPDDRLFELTKAFAAALRIRPIPQAAVVLGWQLLSLAGFVPAEENYRSGLGTKAFLNELYRVTGAAASPAMQGALGELLAYSWNGETLQFSRPLWLEIEAVLYAYAAAVIGDELESVKFLQSLELQVVD